MKIIVILLALSTTTVLQAQKINFSNFFERRYSNALISKGNNKPDFKIEKDSMNYFLIGLHVGLSVEELKQRLSFTQEKVDSIINFLETKNYIHKIDSMIKPSIFIATVQDGKKLYKYVKPISQDIKKLIKKQLNSIKEKFSQTELSKKQDFNHWSFLILSNGLMDNGNISNVEQQFLNSPIRPLRHGKNYYSALLEFNNDKEPFGIYGNQVGQISVYGNNRKNANFNDTLNIISKNDLKILMEISSDFLPPYLEILKKYQGYSKAIYEKTGYTKEISFEEFYMWWYHFIYTQTTDLLAQEKLLTIPKDGNFVYKINL
jgi:DNA-binding MarR family transcriptional regulator